MKNITIDFTGRRSGALGIGERRTITFHAEDWQDAVRQLYSRFEHIGSVFSMIEDGIACLPLPDFTKAWDTCQHKNVVNNTRDGSGPGQCADCGFQFTQQFDMHGKAQA